MSESKTYLINKSCVPCRGGMPALTYKDINQYLSQLESAWSLNDKGHLYRMYKFKNFMDAITFSNRVAEIAEKEGHHPDLKISWGSCEIEIWTHKIEGLTESDFILAAKIEKLYV